MKNRLIELNADEQFIEWTADKSWEEIYKTCPNGEWLLWLFDKTNPENLKEISLAKGHCASTVLEFMKYEGSRKAVSVAIAFGEGLATEEEFLDADNLADNIANDAQQDYDDGDDDYDDVPQMFRSIYDNTYCTVLAAFSACTVNYSATAYSAKLIELEIILDATEDDIKAYANETRTSNQKKTADICRKYLPIEIWNINK
jgi:hypothetical protein